MKLINNFYQVGVAIKKDLDAFSLKISKAAMTAIRQGQRGLLLALRQQVIDAGMGPRLANTWQDKGRKTGRLIFPKQGVSKSPAAIVYSKAPAIIEAFDKGVTIRSEHGTFLALPTENVPKGSRGRRITPKNWPVSRLGPLYFVGRKGKVCLLVTHNSRMSFSRKTGKFRGYRLASNSWLKKKKSHGDVVMFILIPRVSLTQKLNVEAEVNKWMGQIVAILDQEINK
ncbi:MAG: hypothetical protein GC153_13090 [Alphaproteobacteria bacterium]|nr:hypothetical protein [Alphaproteobacteria bacterium]